MDHGTLSDIQIYVIWLYNHIKGLYL